MRRDSRRLAAMALAAGAALALLAAFAGLGAWLLAPALAPAERQLLAGLLSARGALLVLLALGLAAAVAALAQPLLRRWVDAPAQLLEQAQVRLGADAAHPLAMPDAAPPLQGLARAFNELAAQRDALRADMAQQVAQASRGVEQERARLAALMNELAFSVVVCNRDGRVLLYNSRARQQFRELSQAPALADGAELIGIGRSIYTVFDRRLVAHALDSVRQLLQRGVAHPSAQFITSTRGGKLLRAQLAPVQGDGDAAGAAAPFGGFVLMLDDITHEHDRATAREHLLHGLTEGSRGALANLRAAAEMLEDPALDAPLRERFLRVVRDEAQAMSRRIDELASRSAEGLVTRWPLEEIHGTDFVQAAQRRIEAATALRTGQVDVDPALWLKLDSFSLLQALAWLSLRLRDEFGVKAVQLRLTAADAQRARLDLIWAGRAMSTETVMTWEMEAMSGGAESSPLSIRDVMQRHGGEFWFERDRVRHEAFFRFLLPGAPSAPSTVVYRDSRPEYYDFDLFAASEVTHGLDDRRLVELAYTVFDTETTGLDPTGGDEIIQIGAARVVNGRLLRGESFEQLVDPQRSIPPASIPIHGITPEMLVGQPTLAEVLPAFHTFAADTVLVAHNAAFDMRFLQLKEAATGVSFEQPVLDTLLLSALVHPNQDSHRLEAIAERFGVPVIGRHTALGDAMVTAEVFLKLLPLLAEQGIHTLGQARAAAQKTYYARLRY